MSSEVQTGTLAKASPQNPDNLEMDADDEYQNSDADTEAEDLSFLKVDCNNTVYSNKMFWQMHSTIFFLL